MVTAIAGLVVAALATMYAEVSGKASSDVLFSAEESLPPLVSDAGT
jgi:hypothetical protein